MGDFEVLITREGHVPLAPQNRWETVRNIATAGLDPFRYSFEMANLPDHRGPDGIESGEGWAPGHRPLEEVTNRVVDSLVAWGVLSPPESRLEAWCTALQTGATPFVLSGGGLELRLAQVERGEIEAAETGRRRLEMFQSSAILRAKGRIGLLASAADLQAEVRRELETIAGLKKPCGHFAAVALFRNSAGRRDRENARDALQVWIGAEVSSPSLLRCEKCEVPAICPHELGGAEVPAPGTSCPICGMLAPAPFYEDAEGGGGDSAKVLATLARVDPKIYATLLEQTRYSTSSIQLPPGADERAFRARVLKIVANRVLGKKGKTGQDTSISVLVGAGVLLALRMSGTSPDMLLSGAKTLARAISRRTKSPELPITVQIREVYKMLSAETQDTTAELVASGPDFKTNWNARSAAAGPTGYSRLGAILPLPRRTIGCDGRLFKTIFSPTKESAKESVAALAARWFEYRCPIDGIHEFIGTSCAKCGMGETGADLKYGEKWKAKFSQDMSEREKMNRTIRARAGRSTTLVSDAEPFTLSEEQYPNLTSDLGLTPAQISNIGAMNGRDWAEYGTPGDVAPDLHTITGYLYNLRATIGRSGATVGETRKPAGAVDARREICKLLSEFSRSHPEKSKQYVKWITQRDRESSIPGDKGKHVFRNQIEDGSEDNMEQTPPPPAEETGYNLEKGEQGVRTTGYSLD